MNAFDFELTDEASPLADFGEMIAAAAETSSRTEKEDILRRYIVDDHRSRDDLVTLLNLALSPYITFGIKQIPDVEPNPVAPRTPRMRFNVAVNALTGLLTRTLTGDEARDTVRMMLEWLPRDEAVAFYRVLAKDLRAGFTANTVNKVRKGTVPKFSCQLAYSAMPDVDELDYPVVVEPKYDGVRTIAVKKSGVVTLYSRNGKPFENFAEVDDFLTKHMPDNFVFDGEVLHAEILGDAGFTAVMKRCKASPGKNVDGNPVRYQIFDGMSLADWERNKCDSPFNVRRTAVEAIVVGEMPCDDSICAIAPSKQAENKEALMSLYMTYVKDGFEGIIIKSPNCLYTFKRDKSWRKLKPFETADLLVIGLTEGKGKYEQMMGTLICSGEHDGKTINTEVGSGFSDDDRKKLWSEDGLIGSVIEVRYQDIVRAEGSETYSLRFPTFVRFRAADDTGKV